MRRPELSLVLPVFDQEVSLSQLDERLQQLLSLLPSDTEVVFVDDGSTDRSIDLLRQFAGREARYRVLRLSRRFGYERALSAGIEKSRGRAVIILDLDAAEFAEVVPAMIGKWREGYDVVHGRRRPRFGESAFNVQAQKLFDRVLATVTPVDVPRGTGSMRLLSRRVVRTMRGLHETHRFVRGLVAWVGFEQTVVDYDPSPVSHYAKTPAFKRFGAATELVTSFSTLPLRLASAFALVGSVLGLVIAFVALVTHDSNTSPPGYTSLMVLGSLFASAVFFILAILGGYVGRLFEQAKRRPSYVVSERIGFRPQKQKIAKLSTSDFADVTAPLTTSAPPMPPPAPAPIPSIPQAAGPIVSGTTRIPLPRSLPATPPPSFAAPRARTPSHASISATMAAPPSVPPPKLSPSVSPGKTISGMAPAVSPSAPPVKQASFAPPAAGTTRSAPPPPKVPTFGPPPPPGGALKETMRSAAATGSIRTVVASDPNRLFGGTTSVPAVKDPMKDITKPSAGTIVKPKPLEDDDDDHTLIESRDSLTSGKRES